MEENGDWIIKLKLKEGGMIDANLKFFIVGVTKDGTHLYSDEKNLIIGCPDLLKLTDT